MLFFILIIVVVLLAGLLYLLIKPGKTGMDLFPFYAHRGLHTQDQQVPENSLASFQLASEAGYGIELDIQLTKDGEIVVFHDDTLMRACQMEAKVADLTLRELQKYSLFADSSLQEKIPTLQQVLELVAGRVPLLVEFKPYGDWRELAKKGSAVLDAYAGPYAIQSFHPGIVRWYKKQRPAVTRGLLSMGYLGYKGRQPIWQGLLLSSLLVNAAIRPHFVSYLLPHANKNFFLWLFRRLGGQLALWTVMPAQYPVALAHQSIIFQYFRPECK